MFDYVDSSDTIIKNIFDQYTKLSSQMTKKICDYVVISNSLAKELELLDVIKFNKNRIPFEEVSIKTKCSGRLVGNGISPTKRNNIDSNSIQSTK